MSRFLGGVSEGMVVLFLTGVKDISQLKSIENGCGNHPAPFMRVWWAFSGDVVARGLE
jgi:hypothetical protein